MKQYWFRVIEKSNNMKLFDTKPMDGEKNCNYNNGMPFEYVLERLINRFPIKNYEIIIYQENMAKIKFVDQKLIDKIKGKK